MKEYLIGISIAFMIGLFLLVVSKFMEYNVGLGLLILIGVPVIILVPRVMENVLKGVRTE